MKLCIRCACELNVITHSKDQASDYINKCRNCIKKEKRTWQKEWVLKNPEKSRDRALKYQKELRLNNPIKSRARSAYSDCRKRALKTGKSFDLTTTFILELMQNQIKCPYLGTTLTYNSKREMTLASVDRIDSTKGYVMDNVQIISYQANLMKSNANVKDLLDFAEGILRLHSCSTVERR
jgi:hypothetical protein